MCDLTFLITVLLFGQIVTDPVQTEKRLKQQTLACREDIAWDACEVSFSSYWASISGLI